MTCATAALFVVGFDVAWRRWGAGGELSREWLAVIVTTICLPGLWFGFMTLRGKFAWIAYASVPLAANAVLLALPWLERRG
jgi:hypothetical protein